ncbi:MAG: hypothetical protein PT944_05660 [Actinomycetaceae bacterium]|nr:hypothetical protein [Arcanobacterium sp.]MDD7687386.1 hypothetical protein [Actinomycetaceae bacterium]MDY5272860.1 hypothetical protein [Arcanobacterium sp.]
MKTFNIFATRSPRGWWVLEEPTLGAVSQVRSLADAADEMREPVAYLAEVPESEIEINVVPQLPDAFTQAMAAARESRQIAEEANTRSAQEYRKAAAVLRREGVTLRDIGTLMGISYQRAGQLVA